MITAAILVVTGIVAVLIISRLLRSDGHSDDQQHPD